MMPEETVQAAIDLKAKSLLPVHWGKFTLALHAWDEPIKRVIEKARALNIKVHTPKIGQPLILEDVLKQKIGGKCKILRLNFIFFSQCISRNSKHFAEETNHMLKKEVVYRLSTLLIVPLSPYSFARSKRYNQILPFLF